MLLGIQPRPGKSHIEKLLHSVGLPRRHHIILCFVLLQHPPHRFHIFRSVSPIPLRLQIPQKQLLLEPCLDPRHSPCDLAGDKSLPPPWAFMIKQNATGGVEAIAFPIVHRDPVAVHLGGGIRAPGIKWSCFLLGNLLNQSVHLGTGSLIKAGLGHHVPHRIQQPYRADCRHIASEFRDIKAHTDMALRRQIINLFRLCLTQNFNEGTGVAQIPVVKKKPGSLVMPILVDRINSLGVKTGGTADDSVNLISLGKQ